MKRTDRGLGGWITGLVVTLALALAVTGCERGPVDTSQSGWRGTGMAQLENRRQVEAAAPQHAAPEIARPARVREGAPLAGTSYKNVQVLGEQTIGEFGRTMNAMTAWVAPKQSCAYCHVEGDFASDAKYTKVVARRMLVMVRHVNTAWQPHIGNTGVTCYTCHRGNPLPAMVWFRPPPDAHPNNLLLNRSGQNMPARQVGLAALPADPFSEFLWKAPATEQLRVIGPTALPTGNHASLARTERTYGLMVHVSQSLGVNCTFCHNSRSFASWPQSPAPRTTAWHGIRMVRDLNTTYLEPLASTFPAAPAGRLGPSGDAAKLHCATCHQGVNKPLNGAQTARYYPALWPRPNADAAAPAAAASAPAAAASAEPAAPSAPSASAIELLARAASSVAPVAASPAAPSVALAPAAPAASTVPAAAAVAVAAAPAASMASGTPRAVAEAPVPAGDADCVALAARAAQRAPKVAESAVHRQVVGSGRLQFHAAPRDDCRLRGVFILAGEPGEVERESGGWSLLWYRNPRTGGEATGWVQTARLAPISEAAAKALLEAGAKGVPGATAQATAPAAAAAAAAPAASAPPAGSPGQAGTVHRAAETSAAKATMGADPDCIHLALVALQKGRSVPASRSERRVAGSGPLPFHWAPDANCGMDGVFIVPGDPVEADREVGEFTAVWYRNPRSGAEATGWVRSSRLVPGATAVGGLR